MDTIINVTDRLFSSVGDAQEMVKQAKQLAQVGKSFASVLCSASSVDALDLAYIVTVLPSWHKSDLGYNAIDILL